jgi:RND family efflux transporter MFP subunit
MIRPTRGVSFIVGLTVMAAACRGSQTPESTVDVAAPLAVSTVVAAVMPIADQLEAGGVVAAKETATLTSRIVAPVIEVRVHAGERVRAGDLLVVLDDKAMADQARAAEAAAGAAEQYLTVATSEQAAAVAERKLATVSHSRIASLHERRSATTQELDEAEARLSTAVARAESASARVAQANAQLAAARAAADAATTTESFGLVKAPFDGLVTERLTDPGNLASPGMPLLRLDSTGAPHVDVRVDEARVRYVREGDRVEVRFEEGAGASRAVEGIATEIARAVTADERAFMVEVSLPGNSTPRTGTFARVRFRGASREALVIPATTIRHQGQLSTVFVVEDGVAHLRLLQTGYVSADGVEVLAGLNGGEVIVNAPPPELTDGRRIVAHDPVRTGARP